jgi:hypothetical protein
MSCLINYCIAASLFFDSEVLRVQTMRARQLIVIRSS